MSDLWWTKWHWERFFSESFGVPQSISYHCCSIFTHTIWGIDNGPVNGPVSQIPMFRKNILSPSSELK
jgi:hypothetical protein